MKKLKNYIKRKLANAVGIAELTQKYDGIKTELCAIQQNHQAIQQIILNALQEQSAASQNERQAVQQSILNALQEQSAASQNEHQAIQQSILNALQEQSATSQQGRQTIQQSILNALQEQSAISQNERQAVQQNIIRNQILNRWKILDAVEPLLYPPNAIIRCRICGHAAPKKSFETRTSFCIFNGGKLERYVCPQCGCIFGPLKMYLLSPEELSAEYHQHYSVYSEGNSLESELSAFEQINQGKEKKVYLNFGAGIWSKSSDFLRKQGYTVYDYEPGISVPESEFFITNKERLKQYRFNGIFSNDLIEHLQYPIEELTFMKSLLADPSSQMAHATGCYDYAYEYTRFHLFFYTGDSMNYLAKKTDMHYTIIKKESNLNTHFKIAIFSDTKLNNSVIKSMQENK